MTTVDAEMELSDVEIDQSGDDEKGEEGEVEGEIEDDFAEDTQREEQELDAKETEDESYYFLEQIGEGSFAKVNKCLNRWEYRIEFCLELKIIMTWL